MLHAIFGKSVDSLNQNGQNVLHLLAEKGDESAEIIQTFLELKVQTKSGPKALFNASLLNRNLQTPLEVAKVKSSQTREQSQQINLHFQKVISILSENVVKDSGLTFVNVF